MPSHPALLLWLALYCGQLSENTGETVSIRQYALLRSFGQPSIHNAQREGWLKEDIKTKKNNRLAPHPHAKTITSVLNRRQLRQCKYGKKMIRE